MHRIRLLLILTLALPAAGRSLAEEAPQPAAGAVTGGPLDRAGREAWARAALERLDRANAVVLDPPAVARQHARFERVLQPLIEGQPDWTRAVERFEEELRLSQRAAIEHLTRQFRMQVYHTFRQNRREYDQRRGAVAGLLDAWEDAGSPAGEQHKLVDWLLAAIDRSRPEGAGPLPLIPSFDGRAPTPISIAQEKPSTPRPVEPALPSVPALPPTSRSTPPPSPPTRLTPSRVEPPSLASPAPVGPSSPALAPPSVPAPGQVELPSPPTPRSVESRPTEPVVRVPAPATAPLVAAEPLPSPRPPTAPPERRDSSGSSVPTNRPGVTAPPVVAPAVEAAPAAGGPRRITAEPPAQGSQPAARHPTAPPLAKRVVPLPAEPPKVAPPVAASQGPAPPRNKVQINVQELAAQIAGNNLAIEKLQAELDRGPTWSVAELERFTDRVAPLAARRDDLKLVYDLIAPEERRRAGPLNTGSEVLSTLASQVGQARARASQLDYPGGEAARQADIKRLDALAARLSALASGIR